MLEKNIEIAFLKEIEFQCQVIVSSCNDLAINIKSDDVIHCWALIQSILFACTNISKIFCPPTPRDRSLIDECNERGEYLKKKLSIKESSYLLFGYLRDDVEHFDERLHIWAKASNDILANRNIGSLRFVHMDNPSERSDMENFDPNTFILTFWEKEFPIKEIFVESTRLLINTQNNIRKLTSFYS